MYRKSSTTIIFEQTLTYAIGVEYDIQYYVKLCATHIRQQIEMTNYINEFIKE